GLHAAVPLRGQHDRETAPVPDISPTAEEASALEVLDQDRGGALRQREVVREPRQRYAAGRRHAVEEVASVLREVGVVGHPEGGPQAPVASLQLFSLQT